MTGDRYICQAGYKVWPVASIVDTRHLNQDEDSGGAEVQSIQAIDEVQLQSHEDQGEEKPEVEDTGKPRDGIENQAPGHQGYLASH